MKDILLAETQENISEKDEIGEYLLSGVTNDITEILKVTKIKPKKIHIYTAPRWKVDIFRKVIKQVEENKFNIGATIKEAMSDPKMKTIAKEVSQYVGKLQGEIKKLSETDKQRYLIDFNEKEYLKQAKEYLENMFSCNIDVYSSDDKDIFDPQNKKRFAILLRPAIYIE